MAANAKSSDVEQAILPQPESQPSLVLQTFKILMLGGLYIICSAGLITFNKYLMADGRFPFAAPLVMIHMGFSSTMSFLLYCVRPSLFTAISESQNGFDWSIIYRGAMPIAVLFSFSLVLSNTAYLYSSVAFLQMMKEGNVVLVFLFSYAASMEKVNSTKLLLLLGVVCATMCTVRGEVNFVLTGFLMQGSAQFFECARIVMAAFLLNAPGKKLDALSFNLIVSPLCLAFLGLLLSGLIFVHPMQQFRIPAWADLVAWWPLLLMNASIAFSLNIVVALFIKQSSAVSYILAGILKDSMIVTSGVMFMGEHITHFQVGAFSVQLYLIFLWSMTKTFPQKFEKGFISGILAVHGLEPVASKSEKMALTTSEESASTSDGNAKNYAAIPPSTHLSESAPKAAAA